METNGSERPKSVFWAVSLVRIDSDAADVGQRVAGHSAIDKNRANQSYGILRGQTKAAVCCRSMILRTTPCLPRGIPKVGIISMIGCH